MAPLERSLSVLALLGLLATLPQALLLADHGAEHLAIQGLDHDRVFVAGHPESDRSLHIEDVVVIDPAHCQGCLLPKKSSNELVLRPTPRPLAETGIRWAVDRPQSDHRTPRSTRAARAPPAS